MPTVALDRTRPRADRLPAVPPLALLAVVPMLFMLSGGVLWDLGLNYDGLTGAAASKIHPATYLTVALVLWQALRVGNPVSYAVLVARIWPATVVFIAAAGILFLHIVLAGGHNMAGTIDTFVFPALLVILTTDLDEATLGQLERLIHAVMIANAVMAIVEFAIDVRFFPFVLDGQPYVEDTRSSALQGHPLTNATVTACYVVMLLGGAGARLKGAARVVVIILSFVALVTFGGRSAILAAIVVGAWQGVASLVRGLARIRRMPLLVMAIAFFAAPTLIGVGVALAIGGFFEPLLQRFASDGGSAEARVLMLGLFAEIPWRDLLIGPDPSYIDAIRRTAGLELGIENPVVSLLLYQGVLVTVALVNSFALFMREVTRRRVRGTGAAILAFLFLINTFEGLAGKTDLLAKFLVMMIAFYPPRRTIWNAKRSEIVESHNV